MDHVKKLLLGLLFLAPTVALAQTGTPSQKIWVFTSDPWTCNLAQEGSIYQNNTVHELRYCNGSSWVNIAGLISGTTSIKFSESADTSGAINFIRATGALPNSGSPVGALFRFTSAGSTAAPQVSVEMDLLAGFTGAERSIVLGAANFSSPTGTANLAMTGPGGYGAQFQMTTGSAANDGFGAAGAAVGVGLRNFGLSGWAKGGTQYNIGVIGSALFSSTSPIGGFFTLNSTAPSAISGGAALVADDAGTGAPIFLGRTNGTEVVHMYGAVATDNSKNFLRVTGTLPSVPTAYTAGIRALITSAGSSTTFGPIGMSEELLAGYTGNQGTYGAYLGNQTAGTAVDTLHNGATANVGTWSYSASSTTGTDVGVTGYANNPGGGRMVGVLGSVHDADTAFGATGIAYGIEGVLNGATATGGAAGFFTISGGSFVVPAMPSSSIVSAYGGGAIPDLYAGFSGGTPAKVFSVSLAGVEQFDRTMTAAGTTGAQTINKPAGSVNFAAAATTLVVTNSLATTTSGILALALANDASCWVKDVERAAGSFTIRMVAACTAETAVYWEIRN